MSLPEWNIPLSFHFAVVIGNTQTSFCEVNGIECTLETEPLKSGGDNSECYYIPKARVFSDLVLKRGLCYGDDEFFVWCKNILSVQLKKKCINLKDIQVKLLDEENRPVTTWSFKNAYPYKWTLGNFDAMKNEIVVETVTLKYSSFDVEKKTYPPKDK